MALLRRAPEIWLGWQRLRRSGHEPELAWLPRLVPAGGVAVDVGAHFGLYTARLARLAAQVHAFEPASEMARLLRRSVRANVVVHEAALSDRDGSGVLHVPRVEGRTGLGYARLDQPAAGGTPHLQRAVAVTTLDAAVAGPVDFIKIDVEGAEMDVLAGARRIIADHRPSFLIEAEDWRRPGATRDLFSFFGELDYAGGWLLDGALQDIADFDPARHQRVPGRAPYANNFMFFPSGRLPH